MADLALSCPDSPNDTGAYGVSWVGPEGAEFRLTEDDGRESGVIYEGLDLASTVTGRSAEVYRYRLEVVGTSGPTTPAQCTVAVDPPPLTLAFGLFGVGLTICLATVLLIVGGHRRHRRGELG